MIVFSNLNKFRNKPKSGYIYAHFGFYKSPKTKDIDDMVLDLPNLCRQPIRSQNSNHRDPRVHFKGIS